MKPTLVFAFPEAVSFSGQTAATDVAVEELRARGWHCESVPFPPLNRALPGVRRYLSFGFRMVRAWKKILLQVFSSEKIICFNHGQSIASFMRMGLPHLILRLICPGIPMVTSLNGSVFMTWSDGCLPMRLLMRVIRASDKVTVVGERQKQRFVDLGIPQDDVVVLPNTCALDLVEESEVKSRHTNVTAEGQPVVLLHLSLLIESRETRISWKRWKRVAREGLDRPIEVILCGPLSFSAFCRRFTTEEVKQEWIEEKIRELNKLPNVSAEWVCGASGADKASLFSRAHCFVFPSRFPVEAQPFVLLEAMGSGCAIITTDQGEIPSTVTEECGRVLRDSSLESLAEAMRYFIMNDEARGAAGLAARRLAEARDTTQCYGDNWVSLLEQLIESKRKD